jgi:hypothetical protein
MIVGITGCDKPHGRRRGSEYMYRRRQDADEEEKGEVMSD